MLASLLNPVEGDGANESLEKHSEESEHKDGNSSSNVNTDGNSNDDRSESNGKNETMPEAKEFKGSRKRKHGKRSRTGCLTCRRRKKKCAEERPECHHCHRLGLACVWENPPASVLPPLSACSLPGRPASASSSSSSATSLSPVSVASTESLSHYPATLHRSSLRSIYRTANIPPPAPRYATVDQFRGSPEEMYVEGIGYVKVLRGKIETRRGDR